MFPDVGKLKFGLRSKPCHLNAVMDLFHQSPSYPTQEVSEVPDREETIRECKGCKAHARRDDPRHNRKVGVCKFPQDGSRHWECPACARFAPSTNPRHSRRIGNCQWAEAPTRNSRQTETDLNEAAEEHVSSTPPSTS